MRTPRPRCRRRTRRSCPQQEIDAVESVFPHPWPDDLRNFYRLHNGFRPGNWAQIFSEHDLLSLDGIRTFHSTCETNARIERFVDRHLRAGNLVFADAFPKTNSPQTTRRSTKRQKP
uniref:SMI1/KNR4 family protein n=1 Tax=Rhodococcus qingshengii TaxID=334542 RepID=UPI003555C1A5